MKNPNTDRALPAPPNHRALPSPRARARVCATCAGTGEIETREERSTCRRCRGTGVILALLMMLFRLSLVTSTATAATVTGQLSTASSNPYATNVLFVPWSTPLVSGNLLITSTATNVSADSGGAFSVTLKAGDYRVNVGQLQRDTFFISVPTNASTYNLTTLITNALTYTWRVNPSYLTAADAAATYALIGSTGAGLNTNASQFGAAGATLTIKSNAAVTNLLIRGGLQFDHPARTTWLAETATGYAWTNLSGDLIWSVDVNGSMETYTIGAYVVSVVGGGLYVDGFAQLQALDPSSLLRVNSSRQIKEVTIGAGLAFDGTTLSSTDVRQAELTTASNAVWTWANAVSNYASTKQFGKAALTNLAGNPNVATQLLAGANITITSNNAGIYTIAGSAGGGGLATNANQFGASTTLTIKDGVKLTNATVAATLSAGSSALDIFQPDTSGYLRVGFDGGNGAMFQIFGTGHAQAGKSYFDAGGGSLNFRFDDTSKALSLPASGGDLEFTGFELGNTPANVVTPAFYMQIKVDGVTSYIRIYQ